MYRHGPFARSLVLLGSATLAACKPGATPAKDSAATAAAPTTTRPQSQMSTLEIQKLSGRETSGAGRLHIQLSDPGARLLQALKWNADLPEGARDVQPLWNPGTDTYGPKAIMYPAPVLYSKKTDADFATPVLVAIVDVADAYTTADGNGRVGLKFAKGANCVFLVSTGSSKWAAQSVPAVGATCTPAADSPISVDQSHTGNPDNDYPGVARFAVDGDDYPVISLRCGRKWCDIGTNHATKMNHEANKSRQSKIKGWNDEQRMALGSPLKRSHLVGTIIPMENLGDFRDKGDFADYVSVATIYLDEQAKGEYDGSNYQTNWHFDRKVEDTLQLKWDAASATWAARIYYGLDADGKPVSAPLGTVTEATHSDGGTGFVLPPATARWIWSDTDEEIWVSCAEGCCTIQSGDMISPTDLAALRARVAGVRANAAKQKTQRQ